MTLSVFVSRGAMGAGAALLFMHFSLALAIAEPLAKVDGVEITDADIALAAEDIAPTIPPELEGDARRAYVLDYLIDMRIVARKAEAAKMAEGPDFAKRLAYLRDKALMEGYLGKLGKDATTEAAVREVYDQAAKAQTPEPEVRARHILLETEEAAKAALARLRKGEDFAKVADEVSKDPGSKDGELGWFTKDRMVPEFSEAAFKMKPGELSEPVKSQFGWHVINVQERRERSFPKLEAVRDQIERYVVQKAQSEAILSMRADAKIERTLPASPAEK